MKSVRSWVNPRAIVRIMSKKNSDDTIGNRTRGIPDCSAVPQTTAPSRVGSRNECQEYFLRGKGGKCVGLKNQIHVLVFMKCGCLILPKPSGSAQACTGIALTALSDLLYMKCFSTGRSQYDLVCPAMLQIPPFSIQFSNTSYWRKAFKIVLNVITVNLVVFRHHVTACCLAVLTF
jgi:hypothetical protein